MRVHFIVNPVAGRRNALPLLEAVVDALAVRGVVCTRHVTRSAGDAAGHVAALGAGDADRLIVVGGDGTLREVVNGRAPPLPWPVGLVPMGTANLVARELRMPPDRNARRIAERLLAARPWPVDLLRVHGAGTAPFLAVSTVGAGIDGEMVHAVADARAGSAGGYLRWLGPTAGVLRSFRFPRMRVTVDGRRTYAAGACVVQNAHSYGGPFTLAPAAALDTGALEVTLIRARTRRDLFRIVFGAWIGRAHRHHDVKVVRGTRVRLVADRAVAMQADGDPAGATEARIELLPRSLTLLRA